MLNLVRFREKAAYPDGREATGAEVYAAYGRDSFPVFSRVGGRIVWRGSFELMLIGPRDEMCGKAEPNFEVKGDDLLEQSKFTVRARPRRAASPDDGSGASR